MALEKRQKAFISIFLLGLVGLVVDRVLLRPQGGAKDASASAFEAYAAPASATDSVPAPPEAQMPTLAARLDRLWGDRANEEDIRDPFCLTEAWQVSPAAGAPPAPDEAAVFARAYPLTAVVMDGRQSCVLINDRVLTPGDQIGGYTLVRVGPKSAVFERQGKQIVLELVSK